MTGEKRLPDGTANGMARNGEPTPIPESSSGGAPQLTMFSDMELLGFTDLGEGRWEIDPITNLEISSFIAKFACGILFAGAVLLHDLPRPIPLIVGALAMIAFAISRIMCTVDERIIIDSKRSMLSWRTLFWGLSFETVIAKPQDVVSITTMSQLRAQIPRERMERMTAFLNILENQKDAQLHALGGKAPARVPESREPLWDYAPVAVLTDGRVVTLMEPIPLGLPVCNRRAEIIAGMLGCAFVPGKPESTLVVNRTGLMGLVSISHQNGGAVTRPTLDPLWKSLVWAGIGVAAVVLWVHLISQTAPTGSEAPSKAPLAEAGPGMEGWKPERGSLHPPTPASSPAR